VLQIVNEEWERKLLKNSFTSNVQVAQELDAIAGTSGAKSFSKATKLNFLKSKEWVIEELEAVVDTDVQAVDDPEPVDSPLPPSLPPAGPRQHTVFYSSSENGEGSAAPSITAADQDDADDDDEDRQVVDADDDADDQVDADDDAE